MMVAPSVVCLLVLVLANVLPQGHTRNLGQYYPVLKTSSLSTTENRCADCTKSVELFVDMFSKPDTQEQIRISLSQICGHLPGSVAVNYCLESVKMYLPAVVEGFLSLTMHKEGEICMVLGMCSVQPGSKAPEVRRVTMETSDFIQAQTSKGTSHEVQISPQCTFCLFLIKKLEDMLPKERTEQSIVEALEKICSLLPDHYKEQCDNFLDAYGKKIIDFLLTSATPHTICALLHLCLFQERHAMVPHQQTECQSCETLVILTQIHLGQNATDHQTTTMLHKTCLQHPNTLPGCEAFIQSHRLTLVRILSKKEEAVKACQEYFCLGHE